MEFTDYDTRLAAYALIVEDGRVLLTWFNGSATSAPCWSLPGGGVEFEETVEQAVLREAKEETGLDVALGDLLTVHSFTDRADSPRPFKSLRVVFTAEVVGGVLGTLEVGGSTDFAAWVDLAALDDEPSVADIVTVALAALSRVD